MQEGKEEHYKQRINGMSPYRSYDFSFKVCESLPQQAPLHERAFLAHLLSSSRQTEQLPAARLRRCVTRINIHKSLLQTLHVPPLGGRLLAW